MNADGAARLPPGWMQATIDALIPADGVFIDGDWVESKDQDASGGVRLIQLADVGDGAFINKSNRHLTKKKAYELGCTFLNKGDLLVARMPNPLGRCCIFPLRGEDCFVTVVDVCVIRLSSATTTPKYLMHLLNSPLIRAEISDRQSGSTRKRISRGNLAKIRLPIAPLSEQRRIVAKIEELFSELDKGVEALTTAREQLKTYRQSVLKYALRGKFTEAWRQTHSEQLHSGDSFPAHVKKLWLRLSEESLRAGKVPPKVPQDIAAVEGDEVKQLPTLSYGWQWFKLRAVAAESVLGKMLDKDKNKGTLKPYLANINVRWGAFDLDSLSEMRFEDNEAGRYGLRPGDLVICEGGEPGRCAIWRDGTKEMRIQKALHRVRVLNGLITPEFLYYAIILACELGYIQEHFTGTTIKHLTGAGLLNVEIPLCGSIEEQKLVVKEIEAHLSEAEKLATEIDQGLERITALRQSILKKAFSGQLVTQDPHDESASVLLERIKAERQLAQGELTNGRREKENEEAA